MESYRPVFRKMSHSIALQINDEIEAKIEVPETAEDSKHFH